MAAKKKAAKKRGGGRSGVLKVVRKFQDNPKVLIATLQKEGGWLKRYNGKGGTRYEAGDYILREEDPVWREASLPGGKMERRRWERAISRRELERSYESLSAAKRRAAELEEDFEEVPEGFVEEPEKEEPEEEKEESAPEEEEPGEPTSSPVMPA
jgi:hypothetical protein